MEVWTSTFPSGIELHDWEQGTVAKLGGNPPICMILVCDNTEEALEKDTVTIEFMDKAKDTDVKFTDNSPAQALGHMKLDYSLVPKMELEDNHETLAKLIKIQELQKVRLELSVGPSPTKEDTTSRE